MAISAQQWPNLARKNICVGVESKPVDYVPIFYVTMLSAFSAAPIVMVSDQGGPRKRVTLSPVRGNLES